MRILVCLPRELLASFQAVFASDHAIQLEGAHPSLANELRGGAWDVFVVDPGFGREDFFQTTIGAIQASPTAVVLYARELNPAVARRILYAVSRGCAGLVLRAFDDDPATFRKCLAVVQERQARVGVLSGVGNHISKLPQLFQTQIVEASYGQAVPTTVDDMASRMGVSRHALDRWTRQAGMRGPKILLDSVKLARYRDYYATARARQQLTLERAGFGTNRNARVRCRQILQASLGTAMRVMSAGEVAARLVAAIEQPA